MNSPTSGRDQRRASGSVAIAGAHQPVAQHRSFQGLSTSRKEIIDW